MKVKRKDLLAVDFKALLAEGLGDLTVRLDFFQCKCSTWLSFRNPRFGFKKFDCSGVSSLGVRDP